MSVVAGGGGDGGGEGGGGEGGGEGGGGEGGGDGEVPGAEVTALHSTTQRSARIWAPFWRMVGLAAKSREWIWS